MNQSIQFNPAHPGTILFEFYLDPYSLTIKQAAERLMIARSKMSKIIESKAGISPQMALKLSKVFGTSAIYWINLQANYDLSMAMKDDKTLDKIESLVH